MRASLLLASLLSVSVMAADGCRRTTPPPPPPHAVQVAGTLQVPGLHAPVSVVRDASGIPHITASNTDDLFFAQGFVQAQDRLFQMDLWKRASQGRLAEVLGSNFIERDAMTRRIRFRGNPDEEWAAYGPDTHQIAAAFEEAVKIFTGVNDPLITGDQLNFRPASWGYTRTALRFDGQSVEADIRQAAHEIVVMYMGKAVERATVTDLFYNPKHPYTQSLLKSIPRLGEKKDGERLASIAGMVPDPFNLPKGCVFHPRCPLAMKGKCDKIEPTWNASVCKGDIGRLNLSDSRGELPRAVNLESRTARYALLSSIGGIGASDPLVQAQRAALFARRAPQAPIALIRNGKEFKISGDQSTVKAGTEIQVKTERPEVTLSLSEMDKGSWVIFDLPGFTKSASGTQQSSMDALRKANETSWFKDGKGLWVKLVAGPPVMQIIRPTDLQASISVSR